jgi:hypothetical protein
MIFSGIGAADTLKYAEICTLTTWRFTYAAPPAFCKASL